MSSRRMKVSKCPSDTLTMTNRAIVNTRDFDKQVNIIDNIVLSRYIPLIVRLVPTLT